jgi:4-amino-4-deoxy-L-arabinose transferase-like glycosyltransferase
VVTALAEDLGTGDPLPAPNVGGSMREGRFAVGLGGVVLAALVLRVGYVMVFTRHENGKLYDSFWYGVTANELSQGHFFEAPFANSPTAAHPPLTSLLIGGASFIVGRHNGTTVQRLTMAVLGAAVVLFVGLLGRAVAGPWVGLTAAGLAAVAPNFWMPSGILMSETPAMLLMALILLAVVRVLRHPTVPRSLLLGAACGAEALVRAELVLFVPFLLVPAVLLARRLPFRRRCVLLAVGVVASMAVVAPWVGRNLTTFEDPTYLSTGDGLALLGANCPQTYQGPYLGSWALGCAASITGNEESVVSTRDQHAAVEYIEHHASRIPLVMVARVGRLWDFYEPIQMADADVNEGRPVPASLAGLGFYYVLLPLGMAGIVILRRRRISQWFLLVPAGVVTVVSALVYGLVRFRAPFEVCLVVLASPPLVLAAQAVGRRMRPDTPSAPASEEIG